MRGPGRKGKWTDTLEPHSFEMLTSGRRYVVVQPFCDYDGDVHPAGESWRYLTHSFLPYDAGLSLFVSLDDACEWQLRLRDHPEEQGAIIARLADHVAPVPEDAPAKVAAPDLGRDRTDFTMRLTGGVVAVALAASLAGGVGLAGGALGVDAAGAAALVLSLAAWPRRRERALRRRILTPLRAQDVELLLGPPVQKIDVFPGDVAEVWTYPSRTLLAGRSIGIPLAIDLGGDNRVRQVRKLRSEP